MKLKLYEIEAEYMALAQSIVDNGGEITLEQEELLQINQSNLETKARCYGFLVMDLNNEIDIIDGEIKRLTALKQSRNKTVEQLKERVSDAMILYGIEKIESPTLKLSFRKSESVEVENIDLLNENYISTKIVKTADKTMIKAHIKDGFAVVGAVLKVNQNLQIK